MGRCIWELVGAWQVGSSRSIWRPCKVGGWDGGQPQQQGQVVMGKDRQGIEEETFPVAKRVHHIVQRCLKHLVSSHTQSPCHPTCWWEPLPTMRGRHMLLCQRGAAGWRRRRIKALEAAGASYHSGRGKPTLLAAVHCCSHSWKNWFWVQECKFKVLLQALNILLQHVCLKVLPRLLE